MSTYTIWKVLRESGFHWQRTRSWCETGRVERKRESGEVVELVDPDAEAKNLIERAYREGEKLGLSAWGLDQAGPFRTMPYPGSSWELQGKPACQPHQHPRNGTAKLMSLFHPPHGPGSGQRGKELHQRGTPPLARARVGGHR